MASSELKGIVHFIGQTQQVSDSFRKRELVLEIDQDTQYPQHILIEAAQDKCDDQNLNEIRKGDEVTVSFNYRGRIWNDPKTQQDRYFNTLQYWKLSINKTAATPNINQAAQQQAANTPPANLSGDFGDGSDGLPF